jgi:hypothetical protein
MIRLLLLLACAALALADGPGVIVSQYAKADAPLTADPAAPFWKSVPGVFADHSAAGDPVPALYRSEIRSRWTRNNLYLLFICPYEKLFGKPDPVTNRETNKLWEWDVAEVFIGTDFEHIRQYKELQVSPQGEWVDLDIDRDNPKPEGGWLWNSGFEVKARIDASKKIWYGEMRIPIASIDKRPPAAGNEMRVNFYRIQGPPPNKTFVAWQPTHEKSHHVPEAFGRLRLAK